MASKEARVQEIETLMEESHFWDQNEKAQGLIVELNQLRLWTIPAKEIKEQFHAVKELLPEAYALEDSALIDELLRVLSSVEKTLGELEVRRMLSGELDQNNCYLSINSGAGGTEACDWVQMLSRMYQRWASKHGWEVQIIDFVEGDVAGLKSIQFKLSGSFAYGYAKAEQGVHRLVRISPFDANAKRHTSFASVDVTPEITEDIAIVIRPEDVRIDTYRASGAGGQHVNKTDSAVRVTHIPTGIIVSSQSQRSQVQNKETCFKILQSKLYEREMRERESRVEALGGEKMENAWGSQIRNYVLQPYLLVKDARTGVSTGNVQEVMDGDLDPFVVAYLKELGEKR